MLLPVVAEGFIVLIEKFFDFFLRQQTLQGNCCLLYVSSCSIPFSSLYEIHSNFSHFSLPASVHFPLQLSAINLHPSISPIDFLLHSSISALLLPHAAPLASTLLSKAKFAATFPLLHAFLSVRCLQMQLPTTAPHAAIASFPSCKSIPHLLPISLHAWSISRLPVCNCLLSQPSFSFICCYHVSRLC